MTLSSTTIPIGAIKLPRVVRPVPRGRAERKPRAIYGELTDAGLIEACIDGDQAAWKEFVDRHGGLIYATARRVGLSALDAEDVFQNVIVIVLRRLKDLRNQTCLVAWLMTITRREAQRLGRRGGHTSELDEEIMDDSDPPHEVCWQLERTEIVRQALNRMLPRDRELLVSLMQDAPPSYEQLASRLGLAVGSIGATRARCFKKLEAILIEMGLSPECASCLEGNPSI